MYQVKLQTSSAYGSDLTDINSEVLLCLIDENGDSILQRISAGMNSVESQDSDLLYFQRGSIDEFIFEGPKLGKLEAVWISPESGQYFQLSDVHVKLYYSDFSKTCCCICVGSCKMHHVWRIRHTTIDISKES